VLADANALGLHRRKSSAHQWPSIRVVNRRGIWPAGWLCEALGVSRGGFSRVTAKR
jgi:hypothetical protein